MNLLEKSIKCRSCYAIISEPVFLPCGHSICKHHVNEAVEENEKQIKCDICDESFDIPSKGFAPNRALEGLMEVDIDELDLGEEYNSALNKCTQFKDLLEQFNKVKNDPQTRIQSVLSNLRNKVDLRREELKQEIDKEALKMIEKINEYEKDCCNTSIKSDSCLNNKIKAWENDLEHSQLFLKTLKRNTEKWNEISNRILSHLKDFQSEFMKFNKNLFLNRLDEFMYPDLKLTGNDFYVTCAEVKRLSRYKDIKQDGIIVNHAFKTFGVEWRLTVEIEIEGDDTINGNKYIAIYLNSTTREIQVDFELAMLDQLNVNKRIIRNFNVKFESDSIEAWGSSFISLNGLLNNYTLYNVEKDSCMVQVVIKKIRWL